MDTGQSCRTSAGASEEPPAEVPAFHIQLAEKQKHRRRPESCFRIWRPRPVGRTGSEDDHDPSFQGATGYVATVTG